MPVNGFTVGRDISLDIVGPNGPLRFSLITEFDSKPDNTEQKIKGLDGVTRPLRFFDGWSGSFSLDRQDSTVDDYFATLEANYYAGIAETPCTITESITEVNGATTQYRYVGVILKLEEAGNFKGDASVKQKVGFFAQRRNKVA